jgi:glycosyltransferase 2 family protein
MRSILKILFFLGLGILLIWLALHNKTAEERTNILDSILHANFFWISASVIASLLSHYFRAVRWNLLLNPLGYHPKTSNTFFAVMVGYLANFAIYRMGEVTRCGLLTKYEKVPFTVAFGSVIAERALDTLCLILLFFITLAIEFDKILGIANNFVFDPLLKIANSLLAKQFFMLIAISILVLLVAAFFYFRKKIKTLITGKAAGFIKGLYEGLISVKNVDKPFLFILHTFLIWLMYVLSTYTCFSAFGGTASLSLITACVIVVFGSLGVIVTPGGTGAFQFIVVSILTTVYFVDNASANAFAWGIWTAQFILILFLGLVSLVLLALLNKDKQAA